MLVRSLSRRYILDFISASLLHTFFLLHIAILQGTALTKNIYFCLGL